MICRVVFFFFLMVALRKESVDRNYYVDYTGKRRLVALRKESVDRNDYTSDFWAICPVVALRKESVDRN